jgi:hypothetical protein
MNPAIFDTIPPKYQSGEGNLQFGKKTAQFLPAIRTN